MCERRRPPKAVEGRDKRGEEKHSEADPAQSENDEMADRYHSLCGRRNGCGDSFSDRCINLLPDGGPIDLKEVRKMKRVPTLMDDVEFREYLDRQKKAVEEMKKDGLDYMSRICRLQGIVTATAGEENEKCFMASQLDQIFDLAK